MKYKFLGGYYSGRNERGVLAALAMVICDAGSNIGNIMVDPRDGVNIVTFRSATDRALARVMRGYGRTGC